MQDISIIVRTSVRYIFLDRALQDIKKQSYKNWKIILVNDGGSKEKISHIITQNHLTSDQYEVIQNTGALGLNKAINLGTRAVKTEFVVIHDDDDTWEETFLEETVKYLKDYKEAMGVVTHTKQVLEKVVGETIKIEKVKPFNYQLKDVISIYDLIKNNLYSPISFVYRTKIYNEIGYYDETLEVLEDWDFNIRFLMKHDIYVIEKPLANYHIRKQNDMQVAFKNTVVAKRKLHYKYDTLIRNKYLRYDLENGQLGMGVLMNILKWSDNRIIRKLKQYLKR
ncbi:glycosyltransferase family A protein [Cellulosilyticum ruminicola]|uniref:glycosyltransferase family A protein n=1 Tax=Cellulosilyticum ruminicola TaxID=425254 RepID=UPI0006CFA41A|nr:glycosyltransferase family A protein [Cellulosilyticum ruminicola]